MYKAFLTPTSRRHLKGFDGATAVRLALLLKEVIPRMGAKLVTEGGRDGLAEAKRFAALHAKGFEIWRLKFQGPFQFEEPPESGQYVSVQMGHRVLYAVKSGSREHTVYILAIADRDSYDYQLSHTVTLAACAEYKGQGFRVWKAS